MSAPLTKERQAATPPDDRLGVLVVDGHRAQGDAVHRRLRAGGQFRLIVASTREELARLLALESFDVALCELRPWDSNELEVFDAIRAACPRLPVVVVAAQGSEHWAVEAMKRGAADYVSARGGFPEGLARRVVAAQVAASERRRSEASRDRMFEQSLGLFCVVGFDGYMKHWNPAWCDVLGHSYEAMMTVRLGELLHPDDASRTAEVIQRLSQGREASAIEVRIRCGDGTYKWLLWNAIPCLEQQVYFATGQDITARKHVEEQLRESQERFQLLAGATNEAVWDWDLRENRIWRNESYLRMFGDPSESRDSPIEWWRARIHPEDRERIMASMPPPLVDGRQQWVLEYRLRRADGQYSHVYDRGFVVFDAAGQPVRMVGSLLDISTLKNTEERLRESEERFRLAAKAARDAIWDWDLRKNHVWRSDGFCTMFGYGLDDIAADFDWWTERIHPDDRQRVFAEIPVPAAADTQPCTFEYRFRRADGTYADVIDRAFVMFNAHGTPVRMIGTIMDMSERRRAEEAAQAHRAELAHIARVSTMGEIATGLAHELNQPLTAISNYAESCARAIAGRTPASDEQLLAWIDKISANTHRAGQMIRRLRGFTRKSEPRRTVVEINELVGEVIDLLEGDMRRKQVRLRFEPAAAAKGAFDRIQIQQVLVNLLHNACDAMAARGPDERHVTIAAAARDDRIEISVEDVGEGIAQENLDRVFEAFFTSKPDGVGIGLAISRSIVEDHGGRLWVTPNPQQGVTFHFTLPLDGAE